MYRSLKRFIVLALFACLPLAITACGGGGGGDGGAKTVISGIAVKGLIKGANVGVYQLLQTGARGSLLGSGITGTDGRYAVSIPTAQASGPLLITVTGRTGAVYASETTGLDVPFGAAESFNAAVDTASANQLIIVSPLTEAAFQKLPQILAAKPGTASPEKLAGSIIAANNRIGSLFGISNILADPTSDITHSTTLRIIDQMIVNTTPLNTPSSTIGVMILLNRAFTDVSLPDYQTYLLVFNIAADKVKADNPGLIASTVDAIKARAANPPAELDFSDVSAPTAPTNLSATTFALTTTASSVVLSWNPSTDNIAVAGYDVFRNGNRIAIVTTPGYTDTPVTPNITYVYTVVAFDAVGNRSIASNSLSVTPNQATLNVTINGQLSGGILGLPENDVFPPTAPGSLTATTTAVSATASTVTLSWTAATDKTTSTGPSVAVTGYEVFRNGVRIATVTTTGYADTTATVNVAATYFIIAFDAVGNRSVASNQITITPSQAVLGITINGQITVP